jgi:hypothetical protein
MSRPLLDPSHDFDGHHIYTDADVEGPPARRLWVTRLIAVILAVGCFYALGRGVIRHTISSNEAELLKATLASPVPPAEVLPTTDDLGGLDPVAVLRDWAKLNSDRLAGVRVHVYSSYALMGLCPFGLVCTALFWWRGQFRKGAKVLDRAQLTLAATVATLLVGARGFDAYSLMAQNRVPPAPDQRTFVQNTRDTRKPERLATLRDKIKKLEAQVRDPSTAPADRAGAVEQIRSTVARPDFLELFTGADRQAAAAGVKETARAVLKDETAFTPLVRVLATLDAAEAAAVTAEREKGMAAWVNVKSPAALRSLARAVATGDEASAEQLMRRGVNVNALSPGVGHTPLHDSVSKNNLRMARLLLDHRANPNVAGRHDVPDIDREFPLHRAIGNPRLVQLLLNSGADANAVDINGMTPLHRAAAAGQVESAELLLGKGAQVNSLDRSKRTPHDVAVELCAADRKDAMREALAKHGAKPAQQVLPPKTATASTPRE